MPPTTARALPAITTPRPAVVGKLNERRVLRLLQTRGPLSRAEVARESGLSAPTVSKVVASLLRTGLLEEADAELARGRPAPKLRLATTSAQVLGIAIDAGHCEVVSAGLDGVLHDDMLMVPTPGSYPELLAALEYACRKLMAKPGITTLGFGVSLPGLVDYRAGRGVLSPNVPMTNGHTPAADLAGRLGIGAVMECGSAPSPGTEAVPTSPVRGEVFLRPSPLTGEGGSASLPGEGFSSKHHTPAPRSLGIACTLLQESHALCLAERHFGLAKGIEDFAVLDVSTGIGLGVMLGGRLLRGHSGLAGEIGHMTAVATGGRKCGCGNTGCLETVASDSALAYHASQKLGRDVNVDEVIELARSGAVNLAAELAGIADYLAIGTAAVINLFNPAVVFVHSPLFDIDPELLGRIVERVGQRALPPSFAECRILRAEGSKRQGAIAGIIQHLTDSVAPEVV